LIDWGQKYGLMRKGHVPGWTALILFTLSLIQKIVVNHGGEMANFDKKTTVKPTVLSVTLWYDHRLGIKRYEMTWHCKPPSASMPHRWLWRTRAEGPCHIVHGDHAGSPYDKEAGHNWRSLKQKEFLGLLGRSEKK